MTDFKGFNPDKNSGINFNTNRPDKKTPAEQPADANASQPAVDPYADLKMDPDRMLSLLNSQANLNRVQFTGTQGTESIEKSIEAFMGSVSPERHSLVSRMLEQTYQKEVGKAPSPGLLQDMVDNYLIGEVSIQNG